MNAVPCVLDARAELGECPVWSAEEQALYWVDILRPGLASGSTRPRGPTRSWRCPVHRLLRPA